MIEDLFARTYQEETGTEPPIPVLVEVVLVRIFMVWTGYFTHAGKKVLRREHSSIIQVCGIVQSIDNICTRTVEDAVQ